MVSFFLPYREKRDSSCFIARPTDQARNNNEHWRMTQSAWKKSEREKGAAAATAAVAAATANRAAGKFERAT